MGQVGLWKVVSAAGSMEVLVSPCFSTSHWLVLVDAREEENTADVYKDPGQCTVPGLAAMSHDFSMLSAWSPQAMNQDGPFPHPSVSPF